MSEHERPWRAILRSRFRLRTLLIVVTLSAIGIVLWKQNELVKERRRAIARLESQGALFSYDSEFPNGHFNELRKLPITGNKAGSPIRLWLHATFDYVARPNAQLDNESIRDVSLLTTLQSLSLMSIGGVDGQLTNVQLYNQSVRGQTQPITSNSIHRIGSLYNLESLELAGLKVTDDHLQTIANLRKLRELSLQNTLISDAGLSCLADCQLEWLNLSGNRISLQGVKNLGEQKQLKVFIANNTYISKRHAQQCFPHASVFCDPHMSWNLEE